MVEVFKTNVTHQHHANMLIEQIQKTFVNYIVNFDLEDCDKILRVKCATGKIISSSLITLINELGFHAEILSDDPVLFRSVMHSGGILTTINQLN